MRYSPSQMIVAYLVTVVAAMFGCASPQSGTSSSEMQSTKAWWQIRLETDGGITGRGIGSIEISSDGSAGATRPDCAGQIDREMFSEVAQAVAKARPSAWKKEYARKENPHGAADQIRYTLTLDRGDGEKTASWFDEVAGELPADLAHLRTVAWNAREQLVASCK